LLYQARSPMKASSPMIARTAALGGGLARRQFTWLQLSSPQLQRNWNPMDLTRTLVAPVGPATAGN
jgi:hypothetical protein